MRSMQKSCSQRKGAMIAISFLFVGLAMLLLSCGKAATTNAPQRSQPAQLPTLYLLSLQGDLYAVRADGKQLWQVPDGGNAGTNPPDGTHLIVTPQMIYVATDTVRAYSRDGQLRWRNDLPTMIEDSLLVGSTLYLAGGGMITAWDATTGALRWQHNNVALVSITALASDAHDLLIGGGNQVTALNLASGVRTWSMQGDPGETVKDLFVEHTIVLIRTDASLTAVQAATGKAIWHRESQVQAISIDPAGIIYTAFLDVAPDSTTSGFRATRLNTGAQLWNVSFPIDNGEVGSISSTGIFWVKNMSMTSWSLDGKQRWQMPYTGKKIEDIASIDVQHLFLLVSQDGTITAVDAQHGHRLWQQGVPGGGTSNVQISVQPPLIWVLNKGTGDIGAFTFDGTRRWTLAGTPSLCEIVIE